MIVPAFVLGLLLLMGVPFVVSERAGRFAWVREISISSYVPGAPYRATTVKETRTLFGAPDAVKWAALSCFVFGAMFVPGLLAGLVGLIVGGVGVTAIPGLIVAAMIWRVGPKLMVRSQDAARAARQAATASLVLNGVLVAGLLVSLVATRGYQRETAIALTLVAGTYALLSMLQAILMLHAAKIVSAASAPSACPA